MYFAVVFLKYISQALDKYCSMINLVSKQGFFLVKNGNNMSFNILAMDVVPHPFQAPLNVAPISLHNIDKAPILQQQSVIQSNQQLQQQLQSMHDSENNDGQKRREILTRRPSYRLANKLVYIYE